MMINIVFAVDHNYVFPLRVAMLSMAENKRLTSKYTTFILCASNVTDEDRTLIISSVAGANDIDIIFIDVGEKFADATITSNADISTATYYRLLIANLLPLHIKKCIYCDCDITINCDLSLLYEANLQGGIIGGNKDRFAKFSNAINDCHNDANYLNAGVLLIDIEAWRKKEIEAKFEDLLLLQLPYMDQDIINILCKKKTVFAEGKYVLMEPFADKIESDTGNIIHFVSFFKPWKYAINSSTFNGWWDYADKVCSDEKERKALRDKYSELKRMMEIRNSFFTKMKNRRVVLFGANAKALYIAWFLSVNGIVNICLTDNDENKQRQNYDKYNIINPKNIALDSIVIICSSHDKEIREQLKKQGLPEKGIMHISEVIGQ